MIKKSFRFFTRLTTQACCSNCQKKILSLNVDPLPTDSKQLKGYPGFDRVDSGEYRIVYRFKPKEDLVEIILVGKRNDDEVYKKVERLLE
ncbi:MAG: hypothetical protein Kow0049_24530 [Stanieria sp.]